MKKINEKISVGRTVVCKGKDAVIGAVIKYKGKNCILTVYHLIKVGECGLGDFVVVDGYKGRIIEIFVDCDLVVIEADAPSSKLDFSAIGKPKIGPAYALKRAKENPCNILTLGKTYHYLSFSYSTIPLPGDSGSPIIQDGKVVGILASVFYSNATAIAISLEMFRS
ncbi:MAG: trypsin-like peptidase domain-containing protein [Euryarchaeota archaeon]|nr:trypsin-like peptidase domain-containing protein [Euryarchaeota archaeon]